MKYPEYKHSGSEWLGKIPAQWELRRLKNISTVQSSNVDKKSKEDESNVLLCNYVDVYKNEYIDDSIPFMKATAPARQIEKFTLKKGDLIITKDSEDRFDIAVPAKVNKDFDNVLCGYHLALIRADYEQINPDFLFRWFQSDLVNDQFKVSANGITRYGLSVSSIKDSIVAVPPLPEQKAIATFLDHQTTRIDQLIEKKKRILDLLDEQRQATITRAVTKGIDPNAKMKDSGIEWLGEVPEHWEFKPIKYLVDIDSEKLKDSEDPDLELEYIDIGSVDSEGNINNRESMKFEKAPSRARRIVKKGDTILATVRTYLKAIAQIDYDFNTLQICSTGFAVLRPIEVFPRFLFYWVRSDYFIGEVVSRSVGVSYPAISSSEIGNLPIPELTVDEQRQIAVLIDKEISRIDEIKGKIKTAINHLEEYRSSLITQTVTGKIDFRNEVSEQELSYAAEEGEAYTTK